MSKSDSGTPVDKAHIAENSRALALIGIGLFMSVAYMWLVIGNIQTTPSPSPIPQASKPQNTPTDTSGQPHTQASVMIRDRFGNVLSEVPPESELIADFSEAMRLENSDDINRGQKTLQQRGISSSHAAGDFVFDEEKQYIFRLPTGWNLTSTSSVLYPRLFSKPRFLIQNTSSSCSIAHMTRPEQLVNGIEYSQRTYSYQLNGMRGHVQVGRSTDNLNTPKEIGFTPNEPVTFLPYEIMYSRPPVYAVSEPKTEELLVLFTQPGMTLTMNVLVSS